MSVPSFDVDSPGPARVVISSKDEGHYEKGKWVPGRRLNGDEAGSGLPNVSIGDAEDQARALRVGWHSMRRISVRAFGGPEQLTLEEVPDLPAPRPAELLVDVEAAGVNYIDVYQRKGLGNVLLPFMPGLEGVGRVRERGAAADRFRAGQRVAWIDIPWLVRHADHRPGRTRHCPYRFIRADTRSPLPSTDRAIPRDGVSRRACRRPRPGACRGRRRRASSGAMDETSRDTGL